MLRIDEFAQSVDSRTTRKGLDYFEILKDKGRLSPDANVAHYKDLETEEQSQFLRYRTETMERFNKFWFESLAEELYYKKPFMGNGELLKSVQHPEEEQLYVYPCFIRPGKQNYVVIQEDELANQTEERVELPDDTSSYYFHKSMVENRMEEAISFNKPMKMGTKENLFRLENSVFKNWKQDTQSILEKCYDHDILHWKTAKFWKKNDRELERAN